jgi:ribosomal subunit interface protein
MKINITSSIQLTPLLEGYAENKFGSLAKLVKGFEDDQDIELWIELGKSNHHKKGDIFTAAADAHVPKKVLHAEAEAQTIRKAIDAARDILRGEIEKYKDKLLPRRGK